MSASERVWKSEVRKCGGVRAGGSESEKEHEGVREEKP